MIGTVGEELGVVLGDTLVPAGFEVGGGVVVCDGEPVVVPDPLLAIVRDVLVDCLCSWRSLKIRIRDSGVMTQDSGGRHGLQGLHGH